MFMDELDLIDTGASLDRGINARRRRGEFHGGDTGFSRKQRMEREEQAPLVGRRDVTAAINPNSGKPWWVKNAKS